MTALSEALEAAQTRAVAVLAKQYVGGTKDAETVAASLEAVGLTDDVDRVRWFAALEVIRDGGGEAPAETNGKPKAEPATEAQTRFIGKLLDDKGINPDDFPNRPLTKADAHEVIESLQAGAYDPAKWTVPF